ncbi:MAG: CBS domain-containing protein [Candidatus Altiarchaeota archaeon]
MALPLLTDIGKIRRELGITQTELAKKAKVSQSLIARIEAGTVDPRYSNVVSILQAFDELKVKEVTADSIMTKGCISIEADKTMGAVARKMKNNGVSQMPVFDGNMIVGAVSEKTVLEPIARGGDLKKISSDPVREHMEAAFPTISPDTPLSVISTILEHNTAVIVMDKGRLSGIITKADLLKFVHG